jgi:hypothetical protein
LYTRIFLSELSSHPSSFVYLLEKYKGCGNSVKAETAVYTHNFKSLLQLLPKDGNFEWTYTQNGIYTVDAIDNNKIVRVHKG